MVSAPGIVRFLVEVIFVLPASLVPVISSIDDTAAIASVEIISFFIFGISFGFKLRVLGINKIVSRFIDFASDASF